MSSSSDKGYRAEFQAQQWLAKAAGVSITRPRAGSHHDIGDLVGLPLTISVKNQRALSLAAWVDELRAQVTNAGRETGVVIHHRLGKGSPDQWYVTTSGDLWLPLARAYCGRWWRA